MFVFTIVRSSILTQGISNRLSAASSEARFLGMAVSMAISKLVDKPENRISFDVDSSKSEEAGYYVNLTTINDQVGTEDDLTSFKKSSIQPKNLTVIKHQKQFQTGLSRKSPLNEIKGFQGRIEEIDDDENDDEGAEDFIPYAKVDSDPEDENEDPTLVRRDRPKPPV